MNFGIELEDILENDPLGILDVSAAQYIKLNPIDRLVGSFMEINAFIREYGHEPKRSRDIHERRLYSRLRGLRESPEKASILADFDEHDLLVDVKKVRLQDISTIDDVLNDDALGLLDSDASDTSDPADIFTLRNIPKTISVPDHIAKRKPCDEFDKFEPMFKKVHAELSSKENTTVKFTGEKQIAKGSIFVLQGMLVYVANIGNWEKRNYGNRNARLYCVFENGTESHLLLRSLAAALWKDQTARLVIEANQQDLYEPQKEDQSEGLEVGHIYVLKSLSDNPEIQEMKNLYKIGFSKQPVDKRVKNASQDPTYLMADVKIVMECQVNVNLRKMELLLHTFFAESCVDLDIFDKQGKRYSPREWFIVPFHLIERAIDMLVSGDIVHYHYDSKQQEIIEKSESE